MVVTAVVAVAVVAPGGVVDEAAVVVAEGGGVGVVVPDVVVAVLGQVAVGVAVFTGVDGEGGAGVRAVVVEGERVAVLVLQRPAAVLVLQGAVVEVYGVAGGVGGLQPFAVQGAVGWSSCAGESY
ncbi:hypothetical protein ACLQ2D_33875 [Streptomyces sp. DT199]|uniref:hypothetical protein n=1 Tax=Streptomyces sp. DT199 TaxID=3393421 RepID=UPI003CF84EC2